MLGVLFSSILAMSLAGSVLWIFLRLARILTGRLCTASWECASRAMVLCAFIVPAGLLLRPSLAPVPVLTVPAALNPYGAAASLPPIWALTNQDMKSGAGFPLFSALGAVWLAGVFVMAGRLASHQYRFVAGLRRNALPVETIEIRKLLVELCNELGIVPIPPLFSSDRIYTPLGVGLIQTAIYLPEIDYRLDELALILRHELIHLKRRDLWLKWLSLAVTALHWFNPAARGFAREWGLLCELACDEAVIRNLDGEKRHEYGAAILNVLCSTIPSEYGVYSPFCAGPRGLRLRLERILRRRPGRMGQAACTLAAVTLLLALLPFSASVHAWAEPYHGWNSAGDYQASMSRTALKYLPHGITYNGSINCFYYQGQALSVFIDEVPPTEEDLAHFPEFTGIWKCAWFNWADLSGPAYRAVRDGNRSLTEVERLSDEEKNFYLDAAVNSVCYNGYQTAGSDDLYASDPAWDSLPKEVRSWALSIEAGTAAVMGDGESSYLCYGGFHCPWRLKTSGSGVLEAYFYPQQGGDQSRPCVIRFTAKTAPAAVRFYVNGELLP